MPTTPTKVVFLIDEQSIMKGLMPLEQVKLSIMRILLFYHSQQEQPEIHWGYRFFSTQSRYTADSIRHFYPMTEDSFNAIEVEYKKRDSTRPKATTLGAPIMRIKHVLKEAIGDFKWENTDLCTSAPAKHYVYLMTACPSNIKEMNLFFVSPNDDNQPASSPSILPQYFQQTKEELTTTLLQSYTQRQISISIIDTDFKFVRSNPIEQLVNNIIRQGFESCFEQFGGNYILSQNLLRNYNIYGHSFISEFANYLSFDHAPRKEEKKLSQIPAWQGPFKTKLGKFIGNFVLYPCLRNGSYQTTTLTFISEIRTCNVVHASQFSTSWLLNDSAVEPDHDYKLTYEQGESPHLLNTVLDELYATQSILIAELIPMAGYEELSRKVCIEPFSRSCASLRFLNIQHLPNTIRLKQVVVDEDHPVGNFIMGTKLHVKLPRETPSSEDRPFKLNLDVPAFIKKMIQSRKSDANKEKNKGKRAMRNSQQQQQEEQTERLIQLPADVNMMGKALKKLYLELLYTQMDTVDNTLVIIDQWINHLLKNNYTKQKIISTLFDYTMPLNDLEEKHRNEIPQASNQRPSGQSTLEQTYLYEWWKDVKTRGSPNSNFEKMSCIVLKVKEARIQVILYCFIARLMTDLPSNTTKRDPSELAQDFFRKTFLPYTIYGIQEFLQEMDSEDGPEAVKRRDPVDLNDYTFMHVLEKRFNDLPDLTIKFREAVGMDEMGEMALSPSSTSSLDNDDILEEFVQPEPPQAKEIQRPHQRPQVRRTQSDRPSPRRSQSDNTVRKAEPQRLPPSSLTTTSKLPKTIAPLKMQRASSNTLESFLKRTVSVTKGNVTNAETNRGEATQAAIAKVNRSVVNGRPTMKRTGSFTKSAQSPKRHKKAPSMLSQGETGTVILRRDNIPNPVPNPQITPRTSMNRFLGTNLFDDYSEPCLSPSSRTAAAEQTRSSQDYLHSEYPQAPKTPQGTPNRYRKVMMNHTQHYEAGDELGGEDNEFSVIRDDSIEKSQQQHPPYTPRTAARRERDRIDKSQISSNPGRNLTMKFQDMLEEEKQQERPVLKSNFSLFDDDDDDDEKDEENKNLDPFLGSPSRPVVKRSKTIDDLFNPSSTIPRLQFGGLNFEEEESDSDLDISFDASNRRALFQ